MLVDMKGGSFQLRSLLLYWLLIALLSLLNPTHASSSSGDEEFKAENLDLSPPGSLPPLQSATFIITWRKESVPSELRFCRFALRNAVKDIQYMSTTAYEVDELKEKVHVNMEDARNLLNDVFEIHMIGKASDRTLVKSMPLSLERSPCVFVPKFRLYTCVIALSVVIKY